MLTTMFIVRTFTVNSTKTNGDPLLLKVQNACRTTRHVSVNGSFMLSAINGFVTRTVLSMSIDGSNVRTTGMGTIMKVIVKQYTTIFTPCSVRSRLTCVLVTPRLVIVWDTPGKTVAVSEMVTSEHGNTQTAHVPRHEVPLVMLSGPTLNRRRVSTGVPAEACATMTPVSRLTMITLIS